MTDPDAPLALDRRTIRPLLAGVVVVAAAALVYSGWVWTKNAERVRSERLVPADRRHVARLANTNMLTDAQFTEAVALIDSPDSEARFHAVEVAACAVRSTGSAGRGDHLEAVALRLLASADPQDRTLALKALGDLGRAEHRDRATALLTDPDPEVRTFAAAAVQAIDFAFVWPLLEAGRPLTAAEFARAADMTGSADPSNAGHALQVVEAAAGRSAEHKQAALELFARLAADRADPQRQVQAGEARDRLTGVADARP